MTIDRINSVNKIANNNSQKEVAKIVNNKVSDSINISKNAKEIAEIKKAIETVKNSPDIRMDKVEAAKKNLETYFDGDQIKPKVLESLVNAIRSSL